MAVELKRTAEILTAAKNIGLAQMLNKRAQTITDGIWAHGVVTHKDFGRVFAYEVDGYGSQILMDDANVPSLLALPILGFVERTDQVYQNTRKMLLQKESNPYYLEGKAFRGIGGMSSPIAYLF
jgi:meiotically up-regulated gene 157 (Mug157) protein